MAQTCGRGTGFAPRPPPVPKNTTSTRALPISCVPGTESGCRYVLPSLALYSALPKGHHPKQSPRHSSSVKRSNWSSSSNFRSKRIRTERSGKPDAEPPESNSPRRRALSWRETRVGPGTPAPATLLEGHSDLAAVQGLDRPPVVHHGLLVLALLVEAELPECGHLRDKAKDGDVRVRVPQRHRLARAFSLSRRFPVVTGPRRDTRH